MTRLQIEPTDTLWTVDGVQVRVWNGITEDGQPCLALVHRVVVWEAASVDRSWLPMTPPQSILAEREREK